MYEGVTYSKRKILDLINTLEAFETCQSIRAIFEGSNSKLLKKLTQSGENNMFLNLTPILQYFKVKTKKKKNTYKTNSNMFI